MLRRCYDKMRPMFKYYGARGIRVCEFLRASPANLTAVLGKQPTKKHSMDRKENDDNYSCGACAECLYKGWKLNLRWATPVEQSRNRRFVHRIEVHGEILTPPEIADKYKIPYRTIKTRMANGETGDALALPVTKTATYRYQGKMRSIPQIAKLSGVPKRRIYLLREQYDDFLKKIGDYPLTTSNEK